MKKVMFIIIASVALSGCSTKFKLTGTGWTIGQDWEDTARYAKKALPDSWVDKAGEYIPK